MEIHDVLIDTKSVRVCNLREENMNTEESCLYEIQVIDSKKKSQKLMNARARAVGPRQAHSVSLFIYISQLLTITNLLHLQLKWSQSSEQQALSQLTCRVPKIDLVLLRQCCYIFQGHSWTYLRAIARRICSHV